MASYSQDKGQKFCFEFCGNTFNADLPANVVVDFSQPLSEQSVKSFYSALNCGNYQPLIQSLLAYKEKYQLNDWLYYQLIRKTAQQISPKSENYDRYTLYKWFLLAKSGYDARLTIGKNELLFYVRSDEDISDIPFYISEGKSYMCLNYHDYGKIDFEKNKLSPADIIIPEATNAFSYKITQMPDFKPEDYTQKNLQFNYRQKAYHFKVMLNPQVQTIFANYPGVNFESYFNIPLSRGTYSSLIPALKNNVKKMSQKKGIDYLMQFTRNALLYEDDEGNFGKEKRLSPELTLFYEFSDCDDRAGLFFYLVKEIYNLPMIALLYPTHITMAVQLDRPLGGSIVYKGKKYSVCEPTPQLQDLRIGQLSARLRHVSYEVVYSYDPK
ncbi:MAG TPA: hypothetical protein VNI52_00870 [Sphingobacteriaceae bacterium]|nr:hypothetical protein [Sphingobacteriaceae bacterium]